MDRSNKAEVKILAHHCYRCDKPFDEGERKKTMHHAIPQCLKPKRNFLLPVCDKCHREINLVGTKQAPKLKEVENLLKNMQDFVTKHKKKLNITEDKK